jgi:hypothetical protein
MERTLIALLGLVILPTFASAQSSNDVDLLGTGIRIIGGVLRSEQGRQEQIKVGKENLKVNLDQPTIDWRGQSVLIRLRSNAFEFGSRDDDIEALLQIKQVLNAAGAGVSFDEDQLAELTDYFDQVNDNRYVDPKTKFQDGMLKAPTIMVEVSTTLIESTSDLEGFWGKFFKGLNFELDRSTSYGGITFAIQPLVGQFAGNTVATYRVIGRSSTTDRLDFSLWDSLFGAGVSSETDEEEKRNANAAGDAFKQLRGLLAEKARAFGH